MYREGDRIARAGGKSLHVWLVAQGSACLYGCAPHGEPIVILPLEAGDLVDMEDLPQLMKQDDIYLEATAGETVMFRLRREDLYEAMPEVGAAAELYSQSRRHMREVASRFWEFATRDAVARLRHELLRLWEENPGEVIAVTHADLGRRAGIHREDVTKLLGQLKARGIIDFVPHQHGITILDVEALSSDG
jgi:CRP-like cAMP-binding protein